MKPLVAIVGRPNVGKSTLFNRLVGQRIAIVEDLPGTTRDRIYADAEWNGRIFSVIDTGGLELGGAGDFSRQIAAQVQLAIEEADVIVLLVDVRDGITAADREVAEILRRAKKPVVLGANKAETPKYRQEAVEFYELGLGEPITLTAISGTGTGELLDAITEALPPKAGDEEEETPGIPRIAIVGRPNTGKSSLVNAILGEDRVIVSDIPGTTRDSVDTEVEHDGQRLLLIDTAGIRRRGRIGVGVEKFSVLRANRAIDRCDVAIVMIDAMDGITAQDVHIAGYVHEAAKGIVIVINKWDLLRERRRELEELNDPDAPVSLVPGETPAAKISAQDQELLDAKAFTRQAHAAMKFVPYAPIVFAAAKTKYHVGSILDQALRIYATRHERVPTGKLNEVVKAAVQRHQAPFIQGRQLKVYYATQAEVNPPTFVFFVNDPQLLHFSYQRYLENQLREAFGFEGTTLRLQFRARTREDDDEQGRSRRRTARSRRG